MLYSFSIFSIKNKPCFIPDRKGIESVFIVTGIQDWLTFMALLNLNWQQKRCHRANAQVSTKPWDCSQLLLKSEGLQNSVHHIALLSTQNLNPFKHRFFLYRIYALLVKCWKEFKSRNAYGYLSKNIIIMCCGEYGSQ